MLALATPAVAMPRRIAIVCSLLFLTVLLPIYTPHISSTLPASLGTRSLGALALAFVPSGEHERGAASFSAYGLGGTLQFEPAAVSLALPDTAGLRVRFVGAEQAAPIVPSGRQAGVANRYSGADPATWRSALPTYSTLTYQGLYPGIDLRYDGQDGRLKGTYTLAAQANPQAIHWRYEGAQALAIDAAGDLRITLPSGRTLVEHAPVAWQERAGLRTPVAAQFTLAGDQAGFALGAYDPRQPLVIDPTLVYGTFLGGKSTDAIHAIAVDAAGSVYVTGETYSSDYPGAGGPRQGSTDLFVTKLNAQGSAIVYSTIIGGGDDEAGNAIAVDAAGQAWITGATESANYPTLKPLQPADFSAGFLETFATKLSPAGQIQFSSYLGVASNDHGNDIALDPQGNAYITGQAGAQYGPEVFVRKLAADGSQQIYQGFFGAAERGFDKGSSGQAIAVDAAGNAYITGRTNSIVFPVVDPLQATCSDSDEIDCTGDDAFIAKVNPAGTDLVYSTYLGGSRAGSQIGGGGDEGQDIAIDQLGNIYVAGQTFASDFPVKNAAQPTKSGADNFSDAFVAKLTAQGDQLIYATYLGGEDWEEAHGLAIDAEGNAYVAGMTSSADFPASTDALQPAIGRGFCLNGSQERYCYDGFVAALSPAGSRLWSTYLGGNDDDSANGIAIDSAGSLYVAGKTESFDMPATSGVFQPGKALNEDGFIVKIGAGDPNPPPGTHRTQLPLIVR
jgi:hypothetical protein